MKQLTNWTSPAIISQSFVVEEEEEQVEKQVSAAQVTRYGNKLPIVA